MTKIMDANAVPTLQDAVQEILALCNNPGAPRATEPNDWNIMIYRKQKLLPRIQAYNNTSDHEYLAALIKLRDDLADQTPVAVGWVTSTITDQVAAMDRKAADLERLLPPTDSSNPLALHSVGLRDVYLDINGNVKRLYLNLDSMTGQYQVVDSNGLSRPYWSRLAISPKDIRIVVFAGQRIIIDPGFIRGIYDKAFFVEMLSPAAAEAFLQQLGETFGLMIVPKSSLLFSHTLMGYLTSASRQRMDGWWATYGPK